MPLVNRFFVAHAYGADSPDLRPQIEEAASGTGLEPVYANEKVIDGHILDKKIFPLIADAAFCLFEISVRSRPNVFLEYGFAKALGKPCYLLLRHGIRPPSDLDGYDRIQYQNYQDLRRQLSELLAPLAREIFANEICEMTVLPDEPEGVHRVRNDRTGAVLHFIEARDGVLVLHPGFEIQGRLSEIEAARSFLRFQLAATEHEALTGREIFADIKKERGKRHFTPLPPPPPPPPSRRSSVRKRRRK